MSRAAHDLAAAEYMADKGCSDARPVSVGARGSAWHYIYMLAEGCLELRVARDPATQEWSWKVWDFRERASDSTAAA